MAKAVCLLFFIIASLIIDLEEGFFCLFLPENHLMLGTRRVSRAQDTSPLPQAIIDFSAARRNTLYCVQWDETVPQKTQANPRIICYELRGSAR
ncbi:MAG: hypothetical protein ABSG19_10880 [Candidatus Aminicenantales bacterium]